MTSRDFVYWLQGYLEIAAASAFAEPVGLTPSQVDSVRRHLALVFKHEIDPSMGDEKQQAALNEIHHPAHNPVGTLIRC